MESEQALIRLQTLLRNALNQNVQKSEGLVTMEENGVNWNDVRSVMMSQSSGLLSDPSQSPQHTASATDPTSSVQTGVLGSVLPQGARSLDLGSGPSYARMPDAGSLLASLNIGPGPSEKEGGSENGGGDSPQQEGERGPASLYVKNLPPETTELFLYQKFAPHGALASCKVYTDPVTGKCRGVGFVNFVEKEAALKAMQQLHGFRIREGHHMHITVQRSRAERHARARERQQLLQSVATTPPSSLHVPALQPLQPVYSLATLPGGTGNMDRLIISNPVTGVTYQIIQQPNALVQAPSPGLEPWHALQM